MRKAIKEAVFFFKQKRFANENGLVWADGKMHQVFKAVK